MTKLVKKAIRLLKKLPRNSAQAKAIRQLITYHAEKEGWIENVQC